LSDKLFTFRWDVDHRVCVTDGIPRIKELCRDLGVPNTFFVNMGRSTNLREWLGKGLAGSKAKLNDMEAVHLVKKTGLARFAIETVLSRPVGLSFPGPLQELQAEGHELGLHGGMDHVVWSRRFPELPEEVLAADVSESLGHFVASFGPPAGFTSPGFRSDERVMRIVDRIGLRYDGDAIGGAPGRTDASGRPLRHWRIPVTLCGPRTVPFLEWHGARGTADETILEEVDRHLEANPLTVLYGHPCYEGVRAGLLRKVFRRVLDRGFRFVTHAEIADLLDAGAIPAGGAA